MGVIINYQIITNRRCQMKLYAGIDLHSTNNYVGILDEQDRRVFKKKLANDMPSILYCLAPFKKELVVTSGEH
jgi:hypothetical protein